ncbi:proline--tRNA ligase [Candidatus Pacearchaeota archaeon]|nr:proline--tRNA ligase [Candidatus Pacearchaeota archaeon]
MKKENKEKDVKGITAEKDEFSEYFTELMIKADLVDYTNVSGCIAFKPVAYSIWEKIKEEVDKRFKEIGIKNVYFPLFIPEKTLMKEAEHFEGFTPEVAWVTRVGDKELNEKLAIRPTSETIMYESYAKWIRSWRDLPLLYNQWNNVVRWEFKNPVPFLRTREFLWNEGHTVYSRKKEAEEERDKILGIYKEVCEKYLAIPSLIGRKSKKETFAGAEYTYSMEFIMPNGKAIQGPDWHHDGQNFAKAYGIKFLNKDGKEEYAYQNTFAITTRILGIMFAIHSDDKGLILPPNIAPNKSVIVPIYFEDSKEKVLKACSVIAKMLKKYGVIFDDRVNYKPGFKFNEWEMKGIPLRIEIGPKEIEKKEVIIIRRDNNKKETVKIKDLKEKINEELEDIQNKLFDKAKKFLYGNFIECSSLNEVKKAIENKKIALAPLSKDEEIEDKLKFETGGAKVLNIPDEQPSVRGKCIISGKDADYYAYIGKSY